MTVCTQERLNNILLPVWVCPRIQVLLNIRKLLLRFPHWEVKRGVENIFSKSLLTLTQEREEYSQSVSGKNLSNTALIPHSMVKY